MSMPCKGVVVVPPGSPSCRTGDGAAGTQQIANRPIVCHVLDALGAAGIVDVAVVAPDSSVAEIRHCIETDVDRVAEVVYVAQTGRADLLGALAAAEAFVGDDACIVHFADGLTGQPLEPFAQLLEAEPPDLVLMLHRSTDRREGLGPATQRLLGISELNGSKSRLGLVGVCLFGPGALRRACARPHDADPELDLTTIAERIAGSGRALHASFVRTWRRHCGDPVNLLELNRIVLDQQSPEGEPFHGGDNRIEGRVIIHPTAEVTSSIILGPSIIGPFARVSSSYIGPYTSIGAGTEIEGAEIERSIISDGARIMHVSGRIEASTVGRRASIFRDFSLPRAMRLHVGEGVEVALN
jgi:glucose-1-phosphate thymidylyltransferase